MSPTSGINGYNIERPSDNSNIMQMNNINSNNKSFHPSQLSSINSDDLTDSMISSISSLSLEKA